ncbi:MAG TPA: endonuclease/exonuclease/phosphatase family protein [Pyrinomonadaceae bacterium]|nr:endonuclease/exonuclease/phosphatase family protein [Pyrinomonadaceae bacterium]
MLNRRPDTFTRVFLCVFIFCASLPQAQPAVPPAAELLTYNELVKLYEQIIPSEELRIKVQKLLTTPFVNNEHSASGAISIKPKSAAIGRSLRIAQWNIERGIEYDALESALTDPEKLVSLLDHAKYPAGSQKRSTVLEQAALLREADIIVLNEVDWGMKRTGYRNVVADLASALKMNYAFGTEFIEVDPIALGTEEFRGVKDRDREVLTAQITIDPSRYRGMHGTAILSRFPLMNVRLIPFRMQGHDWYVTEKKGVTQIEKGKRLASEVAFQEKVEREVRRGGRTMLLAEVESPAIPAGRFTIVATHLESKTKPGNRVKQLQELLETIKPIRGPVVVAGDMNTSSRDSTPTSIKREIKKRLGSKKYWAEQGIRFLAGLSWPNSLLLAGANEYRKQADPTVRSIHFVASNPEAKFFDTLKKFRFSDGGAFDFRGDRQRSIGSGNSPLANSNQRGGKGFITTFEVERTIGFVGKYKLDWIFVKPPGLTSPYAEGQTYLMAPHFGRTLKELNDSFDERISDHDPLIVDLPLQEPADETKLGKVLRLMPRQLARSSEFIKL